MKKTFNPIRLFVSLLFVGCAFGFTACSDDDDPVKPGEEITTDAMFGEYAGKMYTLSAVAQENDAAATGTDVELKADNDTLYIDNFPIKDIVLSIVHDETLADQIVAAVGNIGYKVGYVPALTAEKDSIALTLDPQPLKLRVAMGADDEQALQVEVKVAATEGAGYACESEQLDFRIGAAEVLLGEGEAQTALPGFQPLTFHFDLKKKK